MPIDPAKVGATWVELELDPVAREMAELDARMATATAEHDRLAMLREQTDKLAKKRAAVEAKERAILDDEKLAELAAQHGEVGKKIGVVQTDGGMIVDKKPNHLVYRKFQDSPGAKTEDAMKIAYQCLLYPDATHLDKLLEEYPAKLNAMVFTISRLAGFSAEEIAGK